MKDKICWNKDRLAWSAYPSRSRYCGRCSLSDDWRRMLPSQYLSGRRVRERFKSCSRCVRVCLCAVHVCEWPAYVLAGRSAAYWCSSGCERLHPRARPHPPKAADRLICWLQDMRNFVSPPPPVHLIHTSDFSGAIGSAQRMVLIGQIASHNPIECVPFRLCNANVYINIRMHVPLIRKLGSSSHSHTSAHENCCLHAMPMRPNDTGHVLYYGHFLLHTRRSATFHLQTTLSHGHNLICAEQSFFPDPGRALATDCIGWAHNLIRSIYLIYLG